MRGLKSKTSTGNLREWAEKRRGNAIILKPLIRDYLPHHLSFFTGKIRSGIALSFRLQLLLRQLVLARGINLIDLLLRLGRMGLILNPLRRLPTDLPYRAFFGGVPLRQ